MTKLIPIFNTLSGSVYNLGEDDIPTTQSYEIPLKKHFDRNCNRCFGRGHVGTNSRTQQYELCPKCSRKTIDYKVYQTVTEYRKRKAEDWKNKVLEDAKTLEQFKAQENPAN